MLVSKKPAKYIPKNTVRFNFTCNLFDGALYVFAMSLISMVTVFPVLIKNIGGSNLTVGLIPVVWIIGFNFPQILIANYASKQPYKKPLMLKTAFIQRLPWLGLSMVIYFLVTKVSHTVGLLLIFSGLGLAAISGSANLPGWFDLVAKVTPLELRGRLFAYRFILGALLGVAGGAIVSYVLDNLNFPHNFSLLFLLAFLITMVSYIFLLNIREEEANQSPDRLHRGQYVKKLKEILKTEKVFRNFIIADALLISALMADAFYAVNAMEKFSLSTGYAGRFTMVMMISMVFGNFVFGHLADRIGHKLNLTFAGIFTLSICLIAILAKSVVLYYLVFVGTALTISLIHVSRLAIIAELCIEENRPIYIALTNMITSPFILLGLAGGFLADRFGYDVVFFIAGIFAMISTLWWLIKVPEPRKTNGPQIARISTD
jgi:MFS family permease